MGRAGHYSEVASLEARLCLQIRGLSKVFAEAALPEAIAVLLVGSCATGRANYRSDVDLLVVVGDDCKLTYGQVVRWRDQVEAAIAKQAIPAVLPWQFNFVKKSVRQTTEPAMRQALSEAEVLFSRDPTWRVAGGVA